MAEYFLSTSGNDKSAGTQAKPWGTWEHALSKLKAGDILTVRGGHYYERSIDFALKGTAAEPITIRAFGEETPVINGSYADLTGTGSERWVLHDAATQTYRSVDTYDGYKLSGVWEEANGDRTRLVRYDSLTKLMETNQHWDTGGAYYAGPGLYKAKGDDHIYIRLEPSDPKAIYGITADAPTTGDPNELSLFISPGNQDVFVDKGTPQHVIFQDIDFLLGGPVLDTRTAHHISFEGSEFLPPSFGNFSFILRGTAHDFHFNEAAVYGEVGEWVAWNDVKNGAKVSESMRVGFLAVTSDTDVHGISFTNGQAIDLFDFMQITTKNPAHDIRILNNYLAVRDDAIQIDAKNYDWEFAYNHAVYTGPGHHGANRPAPEPGTKYVHHNLIDGTVPQLWGREGTEAGVRESEGLTGHMSFNRHSSNGPDAWKIYNNTLLLLQPGENQGAGEQRVGSTGDTPHEFLNNIVVQYDDWYASRGRKDVDIDRYDHNLYWRPVKNAKQPLFYDKKGPDFDSLAELQRSIDAWEQNSFEADPRFVDPASKNFQLANGSPAASGGIDLSATGWPGTADGTTYIGAFAPSFDASNNRAPKAVDDVADVASGAGLVIDVLANDGDPDGHALAIKSVGAPANGAVTSVDGGLLSYISKPDFIGVDQFVYEIVDGEGASDEATVTINVTPGDNSEPAPDAPTENEEPAQEPSQEVAGLVLVGDDGRDSFRGSDLDDSLTGKGGDDRLDGREGDDVLYGDEGRDRLRGRDGDDYLDGGAGRDRLDGDDGDDRLYGGDDEDRLGGDDGNDILVAGAGDDRLDGDRGDDHLDGGHGDDRLDGDHGDDRLEGGAGDDELRGGNDFDILNGGPGADTLIGGKHADRFVFDESDLDGAIDVIDDFKMRDGDIIDLSALLGSDDVAQRGIDAFLQITVDGKDAVLAIDVAGQETFVPFVLLENGRDLALSDIITTESHIGS
ncbi:MAG: Ig-like domain-containing protein [Geminicoccaceae bacterium]